MSDEACFAFLKSLGYPQGEEKIAAWEARGWTKWHHRGDVQWRCWPEVYTPNKDEASEDEFWQESCKYFPPGFKVKSEDKHRCCAHCANSRSEEMYGCQLPEIRAAEESLRSPDCVSVGHSNPVFSWSVMFAPTAVCDYFEKRELSYEI